MAETERSAAVVSMCTHGRARELLLQNAEQNRYALLRLSQGGVSECRACGGGVCLWDGRHNKYIYAVRAAAELRELYGAVRGREGELVSLVTSAAWVDTLRGMDPGFGINLCTQLRAAPYAGTPPALAGVSFGGVGRTEAEWIMSVYEHPELSVDFILRRAAAAPGIVAFHGGAPAGFFITHSDAELGPVYVDAAWRGSGLADMLYAEMARRVRPSAETAPVLFVINGNRASQKWLLRMGCVPAPEEVAWFWRPRA